MVQFDSQEDKQVINNIRARDVWSSLLWYYKDIFVGKKSTERLVQVTRDADDGCQEGGKTTKREGT